MKREIYLAVLLLCSTSLLAGCMSAEQLAETAKRLKDRKAALERNNPEVRVVMAKHNLDKGIVIKIDDIEEKTVHQLDVVIPIDAIHRKEEAVLKRANDAIIADHPICAHDLAPLIESK